MSDKIINPELLKELSTQEQQFLSGGQFGGPFGYWGGYPYRWRYVCYRRPWGGWYG